MPTHTLTKTYLDSAQRITKEVRQVTADEETNVDLTVHGSLAGVEVDWRCLVSTLQMLCIYCTRTVTINVNSASQPDQVIQVTDGQVIAWTVTDGAEACPFTVDVTKLYLTTVGGIDGSFTIRSLSDVTP